VRRRAPRHVGLALERLTGELQPPTPLAEIQRAWERAVGPAVASEARPTAERDGVLTVSCASAVWGQELELLAPQLIEQINRHVGGERVRSLRCRTAPEAF
jgi:predicted nucleic acid-binding Zn ribbon protein